MLEKEDSREKLSVPISQTFKSMSSLSGDMQGVESSAKTAKMKYRITKGKIFFTRDVVNLTFLSFSKITFKVSKAETWQFRNK